MLKVTLGNNLAVCAHAPADSLDLTENLAAAQALARIATRHFWLRRDCATFSGYIGNRPGRFAIQLYEEGSLIREVAFADLGYSGALIVEITRGRSSQVVGFDMLSDLRNIPRFQTPPGLEFYMAGEAA